MFENEPASAEQTGEIQERARARQALILGGLPEKVVLAVEARHEHVDWRALSVGIDDLFMAEGGGLGVKRFWLTPDDQGVTPIQALESGTTPDVLAQQVHQHTVRVQYAKLGIRRA